jgi:sterol desaturase/sphingolipid hydroxylase (fatty acid hydroxylase superfamily)
MFSKLTSNIQLQAPDLALPEFTAEDWRTFSILAIFPLLLVIEAWFARREGRPREYRRSYAANLGTLLLNDTLLSLLSVTSLWLVAENHSQWGLLGAVTDPLLKAALSFVLLDLTLYFWHRANHAFDWLWMFHKVHHSDPVMNVSTAFRLHFVEVLLTAAVKALFIVAMGVEAAVVMANEAIITLFVMFHHSNLSFRGERRLGRLAITPYLHRVHHSAKRAEHDSNYGAVFSCWDRMFGTLKELRPAAIGLAQVPGQNLLELVKFGLTRQVSPPSKPLPTTVTSPKTLHTMIAEAAYYRAEKRGFAPGYEFMDWMEAEREIRGLKSRS